MAVDPREGEDLHLKRGERLGPYRIESILGEGGMGTVYRATAPGGELVALKVAKVELAKDGVFRRRFDREGNIALRVKHPHVVPVVDKGEEEGRPYLAQEYFSGGSLKELLEREGPLRIGPAVKLCLQIGAGLDALHDAGIVHRDVKPANIMFDDREQAYIADFGLVKDSKASALTAPGQTLGSVDYMAPEQIRGEDVGAETDVYSLGCVMCECMSGHPPFGHLRGMRVLFAHLQEEPPDPCGEREDAPSALSEALLLALEKERARRPPTATSFARMVQVAARERGVDRAGA